MPTWKAVQAKTGIEVTDRVLARMMRGEDSLGLRHIAALDPVFGPLLIAGAKALHISEQGTQQRQNRPPQGP